MTDLPISEPTDEPTVRRKRLRFRCWHRGTREMDLLIGGFADRHIAGLTDKELDGLEALLDLPDPEIYAWIMGRAPAPAHIAAQLLAKLQSDIATRNTHS